MLQSTNLHLIKFILKDKEAADKKVRWSPRIFFLLYLGNNIVLVSFYSR